VEVEAIAAKADNSRRGRRRGREAAPLRFRRSAKNLQVGKVCADHWPRMKLALGQSRRNASQNVQLASHSAGTPAGGSAGVSSHANTIYLMHTRTTCFADSNDRLVQVVDRREWHSLRG
jgi:hypothetical protein